MASTSPSTSQNPQRATVSETGQKGDHTSLIDISSGYVRLNELGDSEQSDQEDGDEIASTVEQGEFDATQCLFCNKFSSSIDGNLEHMYMTHGLSIPDRDRLVTDVETLLEYLHLVIFGYFDCLFCGSQRNTAQGAQQHMIGKSHCKLDLSDGSEFLDFYQAASDESQTSEHVAQASPRTVQPNDGSLRLTSGKILSNRRTRPSHSHKRRLPIGEGASSGQLEPEHLAEPSGNHRQGLGSPQNDLDAASTEAPSTTLTRGQKRQINFVGRQLANLRTADRLGLMHLPMSQQRAVLANQQKQTAQARRERRAMQSHVETAGNKTLMNHFVNDVPGRSNG